MLSLFLTSIHMKIEIDLTKDVLARKEVEKCTQISHSKGAERTWGIGFRIDSSYKWKT